MQSTSNNTRAAFRRITVKPLASNLTSVSYGPEDWSGALRLCYGDATRLRALVRKVAATLRRESTEAPGAFSSQVRLQVLRVLRGAYRPAEAAEAAEAAALAKMAIENNAAWEQLQ